MLKRKKVFLGFGILVIVGVVLLFIHLKPLTLTPSEDEIAMIEKIAILENGEEQIIDEKTKAKIGNILIQTLHQLNIQARCVFTQERVEEIKKEDKVVELIFKRPENITIAQWIAPEERYYIPTDEKGYRILESVKNAIFILEDKRDEGLEDYVLLGSEFEGNISYTCWIIKQEVSDELNELIGGLKKIGSFKYLFILLKIKPL